MKKITYLAAVTAMLLSTSQAQAFCFFNCSSTNERPDEALHINKTETAEEGAKAEAALRQLQTEMTTQFVQVETAMANGNTQSALAQAKSILDTVRVKVGIDPKVQRQEGFYVPIEFQGGVDSIEKLDDSQRAAVINTVSNFRAGLYMDLMNLSKRTSLLYTRALKAELAKRGGLLEDDREKIIKDIAVASLIPMLIIDKKGFKLVAFDEDIANEDHTYLFNRELKLFIMNEADLKISEEDFNDYRRRVKNYFLKKIKVNTRPVELTVYEQGMQCMSLARRVNDRNEKAVAQKSCFDKFYSRLKNSSECMDMAGKISWVNFEVEAQSTCINKFY